jgi:putative flippase GtrA
MTMGRVAESRHGPSLAGRADVARLLPERLRALAGISPQLSRYAVVSLAALVLDFALYIGLTRGGVGPVLAGVVGYAAGTVLHYALSTRFVFDAAATDKVQARLFGEFALSGLVGIAITALVIALATGAASASLRCSPCAGRSCSRGRCLSSGAAVGRPSETHGCGRPSPVAAAMPTPLPMIEATARPAR